MTTEPSLSKTDFSAIYDQPDPRRYYTTLGPLDYLVPQHGADVYARLQRYRTGKDGARPTILDVCCSYGVVGTLVKTDLTIADLYAHYRDADAPGERGRAPVSAEQLADLDRRLLQRHRTETAPRVVGLDVARQAVGYALSTGALDAGAVENLETHDPSPDLVGMLEGVQIITTTGGVGYVTERTFDRLVAAASPTVWVAAFCLRTYDYGPIADVLARRGLHTERAPGTFRQRRFTGPEEQRWAVSTVRARGLDPAGREADGWYHADLFLSRPVDEGARTPLGDLLPDLRFQPD